MAMNAQEFQDLLKRKFPDMRLTQSAPTMFTLNGVGTSLYGKRAYDSETDSYIATLCFTFVFVPLFTISSYRVIKAPNGGWHFLGKVPLSKLARGWNWAILGCIIAASVGIGMSIYLSSPEHRAQVQLAAARHQMATGDRIGAAQSFARLADEASIQAAAVKGLGDAVTACLAQNLPAEVAAACKIVLVLPPDLRTGSLDPVVVQDRVQAMARQQAAANSEQALALIDAALPLSPDNAPILQLRMECLKKAVVANPGNTTHVVELASGYEAQTNEAEAVSLLLPIAARLATTEGARILGHHYIRIGSNELAYAILNPYVQAKFEHLHTVEKAYSNVTQRIWTASIRELREGKAGDSFYREYDKADAAQRGVLVDNYVGRRIKQSPAFAAVRKDLENANRIVVVAMDLGIIQLERARELADADARKRELQAAERTFIAIRGFAGESTEYQLYLGQVYYWLGKSGEGRVLFDNALAANQRAPNLLLALCRILREVGDYDEARALAEEAYRTATTDELRWNAAGLRAVTPKDNDDAIAWLQKSNPKDPDTQICLNGANGRKALLEGRRDEALLFLRQAVRAYENLPRNSIMLNNWGLACFDLYTVSGDLADCTRGIQLLDESIALDPRNSITFINVISTLHTRAVADLARSRINAVALDGPVQNSALSSLYGNEQQRDAMIGELRANPSMKKAQSLLDKAILLAPRNRDLCKNAAEIYMSVRDLDGLKRLLKQVTTTAPDYTGYRKSVAEFNAGVKEAEQFRHLTNAFDRARFILAKPAVTSSPPTLAYAEAQLLEIAMTASILGGTVLEPDEVVRHAVHCDQTFPSSASQGNLAAAYLIRADEALAKANPGYAGLRSRFLKQSGPFCLLAAAVQSTNATLAAAVRANEDVRTASALLAERTRRFPSAPGSVNWAVVSAFAPAEAATLAASIKTNELYQVTTELEYILTPLSVQAVMERYWTLAITSGPEEADRFLQKAVAAEPTLAVPLSRR